MAELNGENNYRAVGSLPLCREAPINQPEIIMGRFSFPLIDDLVDVMVKRFNGVFFLLPEKNEIRFMKIRDVL